MGLLAPPISQVLCRSRPCIERCPVIGFLTLRDDWGGGGTITLIATDKETEVSEVTLCVHHFRKRGVSFLRGLPLGWPASPQLSSRQ